MDEDEKLLMLGGIKSDIQYNKESINTLEKACEKCLVKRMVYGVITVMALTVFGALFALVVKVSK
jgi:hypothetical protein